MKREEAQFILTAYRPNGADAGTVDFSEPLRMAGNDPELGKWLAREQAMDRLVGEKLREVMPPSDLRARILAGGRVSRKASWFRPGRFLAVAAALLIFALLGAHFLGRAGGKNFPEFAMNYASRGFYLQTHSKDLGQLKIWLAAKKMPSPQSLPERLAALEKLGCRTVSFQGRNVSIICFQGDREYHLFVAKRSDEPLLASVSGKHLQSSGQWSSVAWSDGENDYVLASKGDQKSLERLL